VTTASTYSYSFSGFIVLSIARDAERLDVSKKLAIIARRVDSLGVMQSLAIYVILVLWILEIYVQDERGTDRML